MRKRYFSFLMLLFSLTTMFWSGNAFAADPPEADYEAALLTIKDGGVYYICTEVDGVKYYMTYDGNLYADEDSRQLFLFTKVTTDGNYKANSFKVFGDTYFSNPEHDSYTDDIFTDKYIHTNKDGRSPWENQVFFLNSDGKYAVRATNCTPASSSWNHVGSAFWTVKTDEAEQVYATYGYEPQYVWTLEAPVGKEEIRTILNNIYVKYENQATEDVDEPSDAVPMGEGPGQYSDWDTWRKFKELLDKVSVLVDKLLNEEDYEPALDPDCPNADGCNAWAAAADSMWNKIVDSEVPYKIPQDGYYRIYSQIRYKRDVPVLDPETGEDTGTTKTVYANKALLASFDPNYPNEVMYGTVKKDRANFVWKLTQHGDSIQIQNAGMGTYLSMASDEEDKPVLTDDPEKMSHIVFDFCEYGFVEYGDGEEADEYEAPVFNIRLAHNPRHDGYYLHQLGHSNGKDSNKDLSMCFWWSTYGEAIYSSEGGASEYWLEPVSDEEAAELIEAFGPIINHDLLVQKNNELRAEVLQALTTAKDVIKEKQITSGSQMTSPFSYNDITGGTDGGNLSDGVLIDGDKSTYWHSDYSGGAPEGDHYIQLSGMQNLSGNCELYIWQRTADNDHPAEFVLYGSNDAEAEDENWVELVTLPIKNVASGEEYTTPVFKIETPYEFIRVACTHQSPSDRGFWHAAELQLLTVRDNPNSQFAALGEVATNLDRVYNENCAVADADVTPELLAALEEAYKAFLGAMVDPTELRNAMAKYENTTIAVVEGDNPGQWSNTEIANEFDKLYAEVKAYDKAGRYTALQNHKYAVMLKAMAKGVNEQVNGIKTDTWYRFMFPTEEMYDKYNFSKAGASPKSSYEGQPYQWGNYVVAGEMQYEEVQKEDDPTKTEQKLVDVVACKAEDIREGETGLFFIEDDLIDDKDASLFRFIERPQEEADYTPLMQDVKDNVLMALDMSTTFTKGEALITDASQLSSNASDPSEGLHIEYLVDGKPATFWHSDYHKKFLEPPYLQVALNEPVSGLIQIDVTRRQGAASGHVVRMYVQGSTDAENWTNVGYIETPFANQNESVTSLPLLLNGSYSYLRFTMTNRYGTDGGSNIEFDPFAEITSADDYNKLFTYWHAAEFQIYPVKANAELSDKGQAMMEAFVAANKIVLKDATAEDLATLSQAYRAYQSEFNTAAGRDVLPNGMEKAPASYAIQNKATGLFINAKDPNNNNVLLKTVPTIFKYEALGYDRNLLRGSKINGTSVNNLHSQNSNHRLVTWSSTEPSSNSALVIREAGAVEPSAFSFYKNIKPGKIMTWCNTVTLANEGDGKAYIGLGKYTNDEGQAFLALKEVETILAGQPAFYIYGDTTKYYKDENDEEAMKFTIPEDTELAFEPSYTVNGFEGTLQDHSLSPEEIYFSANHPVCIASTGYYIAGTSVVLSIGAVTDVDPEADYDFSICLNGTADEATGIKDVSAVVKKISEPGNVYSIDGKFLRSNATLNSLKALGKGTYILNGVKVVVK